MLVLFWVRICIQATLALSKETVVIKEKELNCNSEKRVFHSCLLGTSIAAM